MDGPFRYGDEAVELRARHVHLAEVDELEQRLHLLRLDVLEEDDLVLLVRFGGLFFREEEVPEAMEVYSRLVDIRSTCIRYF